MFLDQFPRFVNNRKGTKIFLQVKIFTLYDHLYALRIFNLLLYISFKSFTHSMKVITLLLMHDLLFYVILKDLLSYIIFILQENVTIKIILNNIIKS